MGSNTINFESGEQHIWYNLDSDIYLNYENFIHTVNHPTLIWEATPPV